MFKRLHNTLSGPSIHKKILTSLILGVSLVTVSACGAEGEENQENAARQVEESYTINDFATDLTFSSPVMEEAFQHYQTLLADFQMADFESSEADGNIDVAKINDVLNNFDPGVQPEHVSASAQEEYLFYTFSSEEPLVGEEAETETKLTKEAYLGLYFVDDLLSQAGVYSNETELNNEEILPSEKAEALLKEGTTLAKVGAEKPQITAMSQMIFEERPHYIFGIPALTADENQMVHFTIFDEGILKSKDLISQTNLIRGTTTPYNAMLDDLLAYYASDILEVDMSEPEKAAPTGGGLVPIEELEKNIDQLMNDIKESTPDHPVTADKVKEIMPEPTQSTGSSDRYHAQRESGEVLLVTIFYEDENVVEVTKQLQTQNQDFPFTKAEIDKIGQLPVSTPINQITEIYGQPHLMSYRVAEDVYAYIWTNDNSEISTIDLVQIIVNSDHTIDSFNYTTF